MVSGSSVRVVWGALGDELTYKGLGHVAKAQGAPGEVSGYVQGFHNNDPARVGLGHVTHNT